MYIRRKTLKLKKPECFFRKHFHSIFLTSAF